jgi:hypothetical protein
MASKRKDIEWIRARFILISVLRFDLYLVKNRKVFGVVTPREKNPILPVVMNEIRELTGNVLLVKKGELFGVFSIKTRRFIFEMEYTKVEMVAGRLSLTKPTGLVTTIPMPD